MDQTTGPDQSGSLKLTPRSQVLAILVLVATVAAGAAEPIAPGAIDVIDGDTIRAHGRSVRLVGFDNWSALAD
jgi:endonuclease YncB( thermonuclease family)